MDRESATSNTSGVQVINAAGELGEHPEVGRALDRVSREIANWVDQTRGRPSLFNRQAYVAPDNPYALMKTAKKAVDNDDIIGGVCDVTEGLMLQGVKWESDEPDDADIFNQISRDLNLDQFVRQWHREEFTYSQVVVGLWWGMKAYTVRGKTKAGTKRKKKVHAYVPRATSFLDPQRVVPLKPGPFGQDRLAWHATPEELQDTSDPVLQEFTMGLVKVSRSEERELQEMGIDPKMLLALNPDRVFRFCRTKMSYERFTTVRLKSIFPLLDLKQQLMEADRVALVGSINFILLVRQGSKEEPASQAEIDNLKDNFKVVAKLPVVVGDHRLNIDIITPDQQYVVQSERYDTLDRRILGRVLGALSIASSGQRNETTLTIARGVGRLLENRRHMMKRALEEHIARAIVDHPLNTGSFDSEPNLTFTPRNVQLDSDSEIVRAILTLRTQNELSRESTLEYFGFDQITEALRREFEDESGLDDTFQTRVPYSAGEGGGEPPQVSGGRGGRPQGGGESTQSVQGQNRPRNNNGNPST